jgi:hypothetical protein
MWILTKHGFFSAVFARQGDDLHGKPVDTHRIMVRARIRGHLEALKNAYRLFTRKSAWTQVLAGMAEETDYDNFKSAVASHQGQAGAAYQHSLHEVWSEMHKLQKYERKAMH